MKKSGFTAAMLIMLLICMFRASASSDKVAVCIDAVPLVCEKEAYIENGRTMVPARIIFEKLGATVEWNGEKRTVTAVRDNTKVTLTIGSRVLKTNGMLSYMDTAPVIIDGTTFVPARAVAQAFSAKVAWSDKLRTVNITTDGTATLDEYPTVLLPMLDVSDKKIISKKDNGIIYSISFDEEKDSEIPHDIIKIVTDYQTAMTNAGWSKIIPKSSRALFETRFINDPLEKCPCEVVFFITKEENGICNIGITVFEHITVYNTVTGSTKRITEAEYLSSELYRNTDVWKRSLGNKVTLYDNANNTVTVNDYQVPLYRQDGYTETPKTVAMYSPEGIKKSVPINLLSHHLMLGYTTKGPIQMYSPDGKTEYVDESDISLKLSEGWSCEPFLVLLYKTNGEVTAAELDKKDAYLSEGWFEEPIMPLYRPDGTVIFVKQSDIPVYIAAGLAAETPEEKYSATDDALVYITPNGSKYHITQSCAGEGATAKRYIDVRFTHEPCKTCMDK